MVKFSAGFALASALSLANASEFKVRVRNLSYLQPFSPPLIVAHTQDVNLFREGFVASDEIRLMAEDGDNSGLLGLAGSEDVAPFICGAVVGDVPLFPGETFRGTLEVDDTKCPDPFYSVVTMLINTNDAFVGIDSARLTSSSSKEFPPAFDAGTENNTEYCSDIPGPACDAESGNAKVEEDAEGFIHVHRGFHGVGDLSEANYDWRNPVAEVFIAKQ